MSGSTWTGRGWTAVDTMATVAAGGAGPARNWHPLPRIPARNWHPLILTRNPCGTIKTRNPPRAGRLVFSHSTGRKDTRNPHRRTTGRCGGPAPPPTAKPGRTGSGAGKPDLRHVVPEDLRDTGRLLELYDQAVRLGLVAASEWGRLRFVAAAEHARIIGTKNPCGLFARLVRRRAVAFRHGGRRGGGERPAQAAPAWELLSARVGRETGIGRSPELSDDARLVRAVREVAARAGLRGDPFPLLKREKPEWTRERWDRALAELSR